MKIGKTNWFLDQRFHLFGDFEDAIVGWKSLTAEGPWHQFSVSI